MSSIQEKKKCIAWIIGNIRFHTDKLASIFHYIMNKEHLIDNVVFLSDEDFMNHNCPRSVLQFKVNHNFEEVEYSISYFQKNTDISHQTSDLETIYYAIRLNSTPLGICIQQENMDPLNVYNVIYSIPSKTNISEDLGVKIDLNQLDSFLNQILEQGRNKSLYQRLTNEALDKHNKELFYRITNLMKLEKKLIK
ncbi:YpiB family protein [Bacillus bingmayongensis]